MATPPQGPKNGAGEALPGHSSPLLRLAKVTQKRGFSQRFPGGFPAVLPVVSRRLSSGFADSFAGSFASGLPAVRQGAPHFQLVINTWGDTLPGPRPSTG